MPYDIPRPYGYRIQPFKLQDDEALVATMANQLLKARLAEARAAAGGGRGGGGGGKGREKKEKGEWVMKYNPETKRYDKVWVAGGTGEERKINMKGEDFNKTADWLDANPEAQRLLGVLRNGSASNKAKQKALAEFRSLKGAEALSGMSPEAVDEVIERQAKPYKEQVETEKKEIAGAGKGLLSSIEIGLDRLGTFFSTIGDDAETTLSKRRASLERQQAIREADPYLREQSRREAEGEGLLERSDGASGVAANVAGALLGDPSAAPIAIGAGLGAAVGGPVGAAIGAGIAGAGGAASGDTYLGERLAMDDRLSEAERERAYEEGKMSEMGINAAVNAIPFGGGAITRAGRTALAAAGRGALGREAAEGAAAFARGGAWRTAADTASYAERFGGLTGEAAEQAVAKAAMRPIAADLVRQSERGVIGGIKYNAIPEAAMASGLNAGAMLESNVHYNELTGQNDSIAQNVPEAAAMGLLFGIPAGIGGAIRSRRMAAELTSPETRLAGHQLDLEKKSATGENLSEAPAASSDAGGQKPSSDSTGPEVSGTGPRRPSGDGGAGEPGEAAGAASPFTDEQLGRIREMWSRRGEWYSSVKDRWESDTEFQSAYQDLDRQMNAENPDPEAVSRARDRFSSVLGRFMLRDEEIISGGRNAGPRPEAANGERGFSEAGESAAVFDTEPAGEGRAGQADTGAGGALGAYPQNAIGTDAGGVPAQAGVRGPQDPGSGTGGGTGGGAPALEDSSRSIGIAWARRQPNGKRAVGESGSGPAAPVRPAAGQGAGGAQSPTGTGAGSPAPRRSSKAPLAAPNSASYVNGLRGLLTTLGSHSTKTKGFVHKAENLGKLYGFDRDTVADFIDNIQSGDTRLIRNPFEHATDAAGGKVRNARHLTEVQQRAIAHLAEYYDLPVVSERAKDSYAGNAAAQSVFDTLNAIHAGKFDGLHGAGGEFSVEGARYASLLRSSPVGSEKWLEHAAYSLDRARSTLQSMLDHSQWHSGIKIGDAEKQAMVLLRDNFPEQWRNHKPIEAADVAEMLDPKKTLEKDFDATNDGTPFCAR